MGAAARVSPAAPRSTPRLFQLAGRIGRVRFMAYALAPAALFVFMWPWLSIASMAVAGGRIPGAGMHLPFVLLLAILASRRLRDIGLPWWLAALLFAPAAGAPASLYLALFVLLSAMPGNKLPNRDGAPPCPHPGSMAVLAFLWLVPPLLLYAYVLAIAPKPQAPAPTPTPTPAADSGKQQPPPMQ